MTHHRRRGALIKTSRRRGAMKRGPREMAGWAAPFGDRPMGLRGEGGGLAFQRLNAWGGCSRVALVSGNSLAKAGQMWEMKPNTPLNLNGTRTRS